MQGLAEIRAANKPKRIDPAEGYRVERDKLRTALIQICNDPDNALKIALAALEAQGIKRGKQ
jgi:hypothetical protein